MRNVLTDLCVESEAHTLTALKMASLFDVYQSDAATARDKDVFRLLISICKYYITKRQPNFTYECMEACGGNGYVEGTKKFIHCMLIILFDLSISLPSRFWSCILTC